MQSRETMAHEGGPSNIPTPTVRSISIHQIRAVWNLLNKMQSSETMAHEGGPSEIPITTARSISTDYRSNLIAGCS